MKDYVEMGRRIQREGISKSFDEQPPFLWKISAHPATGWILEIALVLLLLLEAYGPGNLLPEYNAFRLAPLLGRILWIVWGIHLLFLALQRWSAEWPSIPKIQPSALEMGLSHHHFKTLDLSHALNDLGFDHSKSKKHGIWAWKGWWGSYGLVLMGMGAWVILGLQLFAMARPPARILTLTEGKARETDAFLQPQGKFLKHFQGYQFVLKNARAFIDPKLWSNPTISLLRLQDNRQFTLELDAQGRTFLPDGQVLILKEWREVQMPIGVNLQWKTQGQLQTQWVRTGQSLQLPQIGWVNVGEIAQDNTWGTRVELVDLQGKSTWVYENAATLPHLQNEQYPSELSIAGVKHALQVKFQMLWPQSSLWIILAALMLLIGQWLTLMDAPETLWIMDEGDRILIRISNPVSMVRAPHVGQRFLQKISAQEKQD